MRRVEKCRKFRRYMHDINLHFVVLRSEKNSWYANVSTKPVSPADAKLMQLCQFQ